MCKTIISSIVIIIITGLIVSVCSGLIVYNNYDKFATSSVNKNDTELSEFVKSYNHIVNSYVKEVDKSKLLEAAIKGMYNYLNDAYIINMTLTIPSLNNKTINLKEILNSSGYTTL